MTDLLIKLLVALLTLLIVPIVLCTAVMITAGLWMLRHWPRGGGKDGQ